MKIGSGKSVMCAKKLKHAKKVYEKHEAQEERTGKPADARGVKKALAGKS